MAHQTDEFRGENGSIAAPFYNGSGSLDIAYKNPLDVKTLNDWDQEGLNTGSGEQVWIRDNKLIPIIHRRGHDDFPNFKIAMSQLIWG
jgi:hypothetical protein